MKIEAGKYYKTRDGSKAYVSHIIDKSFSCHEPITGLIDTTFGWKSALWKLNGDYAMNKGLGLFEPWPETRVVEGWRRYFKDGCISRKSFCCKSDAKNTVLLSELAKFRHTFEGDKLIKVEILEHGDD